MLLTCTLASQWKTFGISHIEQTLARIHAVCVDVRTSISKRIASRSITLMLFTCVLSLHDRKGLLPVLRQINMCHQNDEPCRKHLDEQTLVVASMIVFAEQPDHQECVMCSCSNEVADSCHLVPPCRTRINSVTRIHCSMTALCDLAIRTPCGNAQNPSSHPP